MTRVARFAGLVAILFILAVNAEHECNHNHQPSYLEHVKLPDGATRRMHAQAAGTWRKIRFLFNWTYTDNPGLDLFPGNNAPQACYAGGPTSLAIPPTVVGLTKFCFDDDGVHRYIENCLARCDSSAILDAADREKLKSVARQVQQTFEGALYVEAVDSVDEITVRSTPARNCGNMLFGPFAVPEIDVVVYGTVRPLKQSGTTIAFASSCDLHPTTSRPILAHMNVAPETIKSNPDLYSVLLHELTHALGFTTALYGYYRHPDDNTKTYYEYNSATYPTGPLRGDGALYDPVDKIAKVDFTKLGPGKKLYMVTPNVIAQARLQFGCSTLDGVELENGGNSSASTATHWERRILFWDYMAAVQTNGMTFSAITLALFQDMGFYRVNMSAAMPMRYGKNQGCPWVTGLCKNWATNYFCRVYQGDECGYDFMWTGRCNLEMNITGGVPAPYQYFSGQAGFDFPDIEGGLDPLGDYCPTVRQFDNLGTCLTRSPNPQIASTPGVSGRCFKSALLGMQYEQRASALKPDCFRMICNSSDIEKKSAAVKLGQGLYPCRDNEFFSLKYPPQDTRGAAFTSAPKSFISFSHVGTFQCGTDIALRCANPSDWDLLSTADVQLPTITRIQPSQGSKDGGTAINITGTNLGNCRDIRIGGAFVRGVVQTSSSGMSAVLAKIGGTQGGSGTGGLGVVDVELWCNVSQICPEGCAVDRLINGFELIFVEPETQDLGSSIEEFLKTDLGKVVGAAAAIIGVIIIICLLKSCMVDSDGGGGGSTSKTQTQYQAYDDVQMDNLPQRRRGFDDDDLL